MTKTTLDNIVSRAKGVDMDYWNYLNTNPTTSKDVKVAYLGFIDKSPLYEDKRDFIRQYERRYNKNEN